MRPIKYYFNTHTFDHYFNCITVCEDETDADFIVMGAKEINLDKCTRLKGVYRFGVGLDNVPVDKLKERNIPLHLPSNYTREILYKSTANFTVYLILQLIMEHAMGDKYTWKKTPRKFGGNYQVVVVGMGNIGTLVYEKLQSLVKVKSFDIQNDHPERLSALLAEADILTVHIPLTDTNRAFFDKEKLNVLKDDAAIVNTARGALFDERALYEILLRSNRRAAFDVFWEEPYNGILSSLPKEKFLMTPHTASTTREFVEAGFNDIITMSQETVR